MTNGFALNHDQSLQIYFSCLKRHSKNDFLKDVQSTVVQVISMSQWNSVYFSDFSTKTHVVGIH